MAKNKFLIKTNKLRKTTHLIRQNKNQLSAAQEKKTREKKTVNSESNSLKKKRDPKK